MVISADIVRRRPKGANVDNLKPNARRRAPMSVAPNPGGEDISTSAGPNLGVPMEALQDEDILDLKDLLEGLRRRVWVIVLVAIVVVGSTMFFDYFLRT